MRRKTEGKFPFPYEKADLKTNGGAPIAAGTPVLLL